MKNLSLITLISFSLCLPLSCGSSSNAEVNSLAVSASPGSFNDYWYNGQAEITSYKLEQARYGEVHAGEAVLIFVTEDFSKSKQVKLDNPSSAVSDAVKILKLNSTRKFNTGIYPYSMMTSVFAPVNMGEYAPALKITTSSQEWCGHTFTQLNLHNEGYTARQFSYFESEGDIEQEINNTLLEDNLLATIRLNPDVLPLGNISITPSTTFTRLKHAPLEGQKAFAKVSINPENEEQLIYSLTYSDLERELKIFFQKEFPFEIQGWEETYTSGWGKSAQKLKTRATKNKSIRLDYWTKNGVADVVLREKLGLE